MSVRYVPAESIASGTYLDEASNLSDVDSASSARTNLGLGTAATHAVADFLQTANNLSDVTAATARTNLGLGSVATGTTSSATPLKNKAGGDTGSGSSFLRSNHRHPELLVVGPRVLCVSGKYSARSNTVTTSTTAPNNQQARAFPLWIPNAVTLDRIGVEVTGAGESGSVIRLGIWDDDGTGTFPGAMLLDAGTVAGDGTPAFKELTISQPVDNQQIWLVACVQSASTTPPTLRTVSSPSGMVVPTAAGGGLVSGNAVGYIQTFSGAFSGAWSGTSTTSSEPKIWIRAA